MNSKYPNAPEPSAAYPKALHQLVRYWRAHGLRRTAERTNLLEHIYSIEGAFTADDLVSSFAAYYFTLAPATIYNALDLFCSLGLTVRVLCGDRILYERALGEPLCHFFRSCTRCKRVDKLPAEQVEKKLESVKYQRFKAKAVSICTYGLCSNCSAQLTKANNEYLRTHWWEEDEDEEVN